MKIVFCTIHPAPYFDRLFDYLRANDVETEAWYVEARNAEKEWKAYVPEDVHLYKDMSLWQKARRWAQADFVVLPWAQRESLIIALWLWLCRRRFAFYLDHPDPNSTKATGVVRMAKRLLMGLATCMFPACQTCAEYLQKTYSLSTDKMRVFPYTHSERPQEQDAINAARIRALRQGCRPRLLIASRFVERKGYGVVLEAFQLLKKEGRLDQLDITIAGSGELYGTYKAALSALAPHITFCGWVENQEYERLLSQTDIYLHPSLFEPFGIPPLDAMERGKMLIASEGVKSTDIFTDCKGVILYPARDAKALTDALIHCLDQPTYLYNWAADNPQHCRRYYAMGVNLQAILSASTTAQ